MSRATCPPLQQDRQSQLRRTGRCRRRSGGRAKIKIHSRWSLRALLRCEKWALRKTEHSRDEICRETSHRRVVILHRSIEISALDGNTVLGSFKLRLQVKKSLVRLYLGITLNHNQQPRERITQLPLCRLKLLELRGLGWRLVRIELRAADAGACIRHFDQG